jgi:hypothetical protein
MSSIASIFSAKIQSGVIVISKLLEIPIKSKKFIKKYNYI